MVVKAHSLYLALACLVIQPVLTQSVISSLSFGQTTPISQNGQIPGFHIGYEGTAPQILSDRIVLTPPAPGHIRAGFWSDNTLPAETFQLDVDFRSSGPDRGSGNMQIWFTKDVVPSSTLRSIYTVERFEGFALVIDQYGGSGGAVRGFLSDGTIDYKSHHNVDSLAFGHCDFSYRNLGKMTHLHIKGTGQGLEVVIDQRPCFRTELIKFPPNYHFGLTAASAETPDSIEVSRFSVSSMSGNLPPFPDHHQQPVLPPKNQQGDGYNTAPSSAEYSAQHHELLNRLHSLSQAVEHINREVGHLSNAQTQRHDEVKTSVGNMPAVPNQLMDSMSRKIDTIAADVGLIKKEIGMAGFGSGEYKDNLARLQTALRDGQSELMGSLPKNLGEIVNTQAPKMWTFLFCLCAFQLVLVGGYVAYKRRWKNSPKKLL